MIKIMKRYIILAAVCLLGVAACSDLDLQPKGILDEATLFNSDYGVKKYLAAIYNDLPIEDFTYKAAGDGHKGYAVTNAAGYHNGNRWEALKGYSSTIVGFTAGRGNEDTAGAFEYWPYGMIRNINTFINNLPDYKENFSEDVYNNYLGEGYFLRAYYYFGLAKRYGGVPIVAEAQNPTDDLETLKISRSTEYDTWMFIHDDLENAISLMNSNKDGNGRATRYAAAALMSKAMMFAGSVAKYNQYVGTIGEATDLGLMGMDPSVAPQFFKYAYDACKIIADAGFSLHTGADKEKAYTEVFLENTNEDIFVKLYGNKDTTPWNMSLNHCWDALTLPNAAGMSTFVGATIFPTWDIIGMYEHPAIVDENGYPVRFESLADFANSPELEPRCKANFWFSGMTDPVSGTVFDTQAGVYTSFSLKADDPQCVPETNVETDFTKANRVMGSRPGQVNSAVGSFTNVKINGAHGVATGTGDEGYTSTGAFIRKYMNYKATTEQRGIFNSEQSFKVLRYGEVLMDWAEAAYELYLENGDASLKAESNKLVNQIRERAGAHPHQFVDDPEDVGSERFGFELDENLQYIRDERCRELCLENRIQWDYRRWRIAHLMFDNYLPKTLFGYKVLAEDKYIFLNEAERFGRRLTFNKRSYYEQIPGFEINKNDKLIRNDGY